MNLPDYRGLTPLKLARRYGQEDIEEMLTERGAVLEAPKEHDDDDDEKGFAECQMAAAVIPSVDHVILIAKCGGSHTRSGYLKAFQSTVPS